MEGIFSPVLWDASKCLCLSQIWQDLRSQVNGQELGKNWNGRSCRMPEFLQKEVRCQVHWGFVLLWNYHSHWNMTEKVGIRKQLTELMVDYSIFVGVLDKS